MAKNSTFKYRPRSITKTMSKSKFGGSHKKYTKPCKSDTVKCKKVKKSKYGGKSGNRSFMYNVKLTVYLGGDDGEPINTTDISTEDKPAIISHIKQNIWSNINDYIGTLVPEQQFQLTANRIAHKWTHDGINIIATISLNTNFENDDITEIMKDWFELNQMSEIVNSPSYVITGIVNISVSKIE